MDNKKILSVFAIGVLSIFTFFGFQLYDIYKTDYAPSAAVNNMADITVKDSFIILNENGGTAEIGIKLNKAPAFGTKVGLKISQNTSNLTTLSTNSLTFDSSTWNVVQKITLTAIDNTTDEPQNNTTNITIAVNLTTTTDSDYILSASNLSKNIVAKILDNENVTPQFNLSKKAINDSKNVNVYLINILPTSTANQNIIDPNTGLNNITTASIVDDYKKNVNESVKLLNEGTAFRKYANSNYSDKSSPNYLNYNLVDMKDLPITLPFILIQDTFDINKVVYYPDYLNILKNINVCDIVDNQGIDEIWINSYRMNRMTLIPSNMSMGNNVKNYWTNPGSYGDISPYSYPSLNKNDLVQCNKSYTIYNYEYLTTAEQITEIHAKQFDRVLQSTLGQVRPKRDSNTLDYWDFYAQNTTNENVCGGPEFTVNSRVNNVSTQNNFAMTNTTNSICPRMQWINYGETKPVSCKDWGCTKIGWLTYWMNSIPGKGNKMTSTNNENYWFDILINNEKYPSGIMPIGLDIKAQTVWEVQGTNKVYKTIFQITNTGSKKSINIKLPAKSSLSTGNRLVTSYLVGGATGSTLSSNSDINDNVTIPYLGGVTYTISDNIDRGNAVFMRNFWNSISSLDDYLRCGIEMNLVPSKVSAECRLIDDVPPPAVPGLIVSPTTSALPENAGSVRFTVRLNSQPNSNVVISLNLLNKSLGTISPSPSNLTFTPVNWFTNQYFSVSAVDNSIDEISNNVTNLILSVDDIKSDDQYDTVPDSTINLTFIDDEITTIKPAGSTLINIRTQPNITSSIVTTLPTTGEKIECVKAVAGSYTWWAKISDSKYVYMGSTYTSRLVNFYDKNNSLLDIINFNQLAICP